MKRQWPSAFERIGVSSLLLRRHRPQIGDDRIEILLAHARIPGEAQRRQQLAPVLADALRDGAFDLGIAPAADACAVMLRDTLTPHGPSTFSPPVPRRFLRSLWPSWRGEWHSMQWPIV